MKCKFYHPERANQSHRALADELRENARLSSAQKEGGRGASLAQRGSPTLGTSTARGSVTSSGTGSPVFFGTSSPSLEQQLQSSLTLDPSGRAVFKVPGDETLELWWDSAVPVTGSSRMPFSASSSRTPSSSTCSSSGSYSVTEWRSLLSPFATDPTSLFSADSGLGSYEQQQHQPKLQPQPQPQQAQHHQLQHHQPPPHHSKGMCRGQARPPRLLEAPSGCLACCPHLGAPPPPLPHLLQSYYSSPAECPPCRPSTSCGYEPPQYPQSAPLHHYSLPNYIQLGGGGEGRGQQNCWSESLPWMPRSCSLPESGHLAGLPGPGHYFQEQHQQQSWAGAYPGPLPPLPVQPEPPAISLDMEREEMRMKLQAIFNPYQVDRVMSMHPHLKDAQRLAAEILTLKSKGEMFD